MSSSSEIFEFYIILAALGRMHPQDDGHHYLRASDWLQSNSQDSGIRHANLIQLHLFSLAILEDISLLLTGSNGVLSAASFSVEVSHIPLLH